jgi:hypothetical protein
MPTVMKDDRKDLDQIAAAAAHVESDIREFVRRDQFAPRRTSRPEHRPENRQENRQENQTRSELRAATIPNAPQLQPQGAGAANTPPNEIQELIRRVSGGSMEEIDKVILELQSVREMLRNEGQRVTRELAGYASLNTAATTAMKIIAESMTQWKSQPGREFDRR